MATIVLRNGKTLVYNKVKRMYITDGTLKLTGEDRNEEDFLIAHIPLDIVERAEFEKPCKIIYPRKKKK